MKRFVISISKKTGYLLSALVIVAAIIVVVTRVLTPYLDAHRPDFEKWASQLLSMPVKIENVRISWYHYQPEISLNQVTILSRESNAPVMQIQKVRVFFSIPQSLWQKQPVPSGIMVAGTDLVIRQNASGEFVVQGFPAIGGFQDQPFQQESRFSDVMAWLSAQPRLMLRDVDIRYTGMYGQKRNVTLYNLSLVNESHLHTVLGKAILHQDIPTNVAIAAQWNGNVMDYPNIHAKIYLYVSGLSIAQWMKGYVWNGWQINEGVVSAKIWATWKQGNFHHVQSLFQAFGIKFYSAADKSTHVVNRLSGNIGWKRNGNQQIIAGDDLLVDLPSHLWPVTSFYTQWSPDANQQLIPSVVNLGYLDLDDVQAYLASSPPVLSNAARKMMTDLNVSGNIESAAIHFGGAFTDPRATTASIRFSHVQFAPWRKLPGVKNLSGLLNWNGKEGNLQLDSHRTIFTLDSVFMNPIELQALSGNIQWRQDERQYWRISSSSLDLMNDDLQLNMKGSLDLSPDLTPFVDVNAHASVQNIKHVTRYLPMRVFDADLVKWLQEAFLSGEVQSGDIVLRGPLMDFPFDKGNGQFYISTAVNKVMLHYAPDWPSIQNIVGKVIFSGRQITVDIDHAQIFDIPVGKVHAVIPYLGEDKSSILQVSAAEVQADFSQALHFVHNSPLEKTLGKMFHGVEVKGPISLNLGLIVPLDKPDDIKVNGLINMTNARMDLVPWRLNIEKLNGLIYFTEKSTSAKAIQGEMFGNPLKLDLATVQKSKTLAIVRASVQNRLSLTDLEQWLNIPFTRVATGSADVSSILDLSFDEPMQIHLQSNLAGVAVDLPEQYAKKAEEIRAFTADITAQEKQPLRVKLGYGDLLNAALILNQAQDSFHLTAANLRLGKGGADWPPSNGLYFSGSFDQLDWDKIKSYQSQSGSANLPDLPLRGIDISVRALNLPIQRLTQARLQITPVSGNWNLDINSNEVTGRVQFPSNFSSKGQITANLQRLNLRPGTGQSSKLMADARSIPSINFSAANAEYNGMPLGQVTLKTSPSASGMTIHSFQVHSPRIDLQATGSWTQSGGRNMTRLQGMAATNQLSDLLNSLGVNAHNIIASKGKINFNLSWREAPSGLSLSNMSGRASLDIGQGRIVEVSEASGAKMDIGKMLSIFSLQTIPRRLSFDFSDVFEKGYVFDSFKGDFNFDDGDAYTNNTRFDGPVARVEIYGEIGLADKNYDLTLSVTPHVTSSIPVAATIISGPFVGLAAFAVDKIISSEISKATTYYYSVTGPWSNPTWNSVKVLKKP